MLVISNETPQVFTLQEKAQDVSTLVVTAAERLTALDKCPFEANSMGSALASLQARDVAVVPDDGVWFVICLQRCTTMWSCSVGD